jgi:microcystin-dependent protein
VDVPVLGISNGDSLSFVEQALIEFLTSTVDGSGIKISLPDDIYCTLVRQYLPTCGDITALALFEALIKAACDLQAQITATNTIVTNINGGYATGCLSGVNSSSSAHLVIQAIIIKLCAVDSALTALALNLSTNYVLLSELNTLIQNYINSTIISTQNYPKMIPYTAMEYYGSLSVFDGTGKGLAAAGFDKIYLCNGLNGTPDKRGRVGVGAIAAVPGGAMNPAVDPAFSGNPNYSVGDVNGANLIVIDGTQIPAHTHIATVTDPGHHHIVAKGDNPGTALQLTGVTSSGAGENALIYTPDRGPVIAVTTVTGISVTNASTGGGLGHSNIQPVLAAYYIIYLP